MSDETDLSDGFPEYEKPPRDVVPKGLVPVPTDIPTGPAMVVSYDLTDDGITRTEERTFIGRTITRKTTDD